MLGEIIPHVEDRLSQDRKALGMTVQWDHHAANMGDSRAD